MKGSFAHHCTNPVKHVRNRNTPVGHPAQEGLCAVNRVYNPDAAPFFIRTGPSLFTEKCVAGKMLRQRVTYQELGLVVRLADEVMRTLAPPNLVSIPP
jgi:hypothetical protein